MFANSFEVKHMLRNLFLGLSAAAALSAADTATAKVTFYKDVLPVLQKNCQECHRPGEAGPMSFVSYQETRPWAKAIRGAVLQHTMPPWYANPAHGEFRNERRLTEAETATLIAWAENGALEGIAKEAPAARKFVDGWNIGKPDLVLSLPKAFDVPARGTIEYQYVVIPTGFKEDRWVEMAEVRPGNRTVNHHVIAFVRPPGVKWLTELKPGESLDGRLPHRITTCIAARGILRVRRAGSRTGLHCRCPRCCSMIPRAFR